MASKTDGRGVVNHLPETFRVMFNRGAKKHKLAG
jgi:hypothetical protein